jgi:hypothetical protein
MRLLGDDLQRLPANAARTAQDGDLFCDSDMIPKRQLIR